MGLREANAARTKKLIVGVAMELFFDRGYDGATMEDIARLADVSSSTLYRYFPTKEEVVMGYLGDPGLIATALRGRPADEPAEVAAGHALIAFLSMAGEDPEAGGRFRRLLEDNPRPRARLMEWFGEMHAELVLALEERLTGPTGGLQAGAMAWIAISVLQRASEDADVEGEVRTPAQIAEQVMHDLALEPLPTPRVAR